MLIKRSSICTLIYAKRIAGPKSKNFIVMCTDLGPIHLDLVAALEESESF
jgi:hypothetical protein